jgi:hypothetical protein
MNDYAQAMYRIGFIEGGLVELLIAAQANAPMSDIIELIERELRVVRASIEIQDPTDGVVGKPREQT